MACRRSPPRAESLPVTPSLAAILTAAREDLGWSVERAAEVTGFLPEFIELVEAGTIRYPARESLSIFALAYDIPMEPLLATRQR